MPKRASKEDRKRALNALIYSDAEDGNITWADAMKPQGLEAATDRELHTATFGAGHADDEAPRGNRDTGASPSLPSAPGIKGSSPLIGD